jgi:phosphonate transport system substrate-binding protein
MAAFTACGGNGGAAAGGEISQLRFATLIDDDSPESGRVFEVFREALEEHIGIPVVHIEGATRLVGIEAMRAGELEMMWSSPFVYLLAQQSTEVERLVVTDSPVAVNKTVFITANDNIQSIDDLAGHSFAFISTASTSGFLYPVYHLMNLFGLSRDDILTGGLFSTVAYSGSQNASVMGVIHGDYDAAAVGNLNVESMLAAGLFADDDFRIIGSTEIIPFPGYIAAGHLSPELRQQIREFLLAFENEAYFDERFNNPDVRFVLPDEGQIRHLESMVAALDIDLENE